MNTKRIATLLAIAGVSAAAFTLSTGRSSKSIVLNTDQNPVFKTDLTKALRSVHIANANASNGDTAAQTMQVFGRLLMGFPDQASYQAQMGNGSAVLQAMFAQDGLAGRISGTRDIIASMASAAGITSCASAPTSGTLTGTEGTLTWGVATNSAPSTYPKSGAYEKKVTYVGTKNGITTTASFEFFCDYPGMMMKVVDSVSGVDNMKYAIYYDRNSDADFRMDFYMWGKDALMGSEDIKLALQLRYNDTTKISQINVTRAGSSVDQSTKCLGYRYHAAVNLATTQLTLFTGELGTNSNISCATFTGNAVATSAGVTSTRYPQQGGTDNEYQGCFATFDTDPNTVTTPTACSGLDITSPNAPAIDETGSWSLKWMQENLKTKVEAL